MNDARGHRAVLLTPPGAGAIAVIRILGPNPIRLLSPLFRPMTGPSFVETRTDRARYGLLIDGDETIDDVLVIATTVHDQPVVEICAHGGVRIVERILQVLERSGAEVGAGEDPTPPVWPSQNLIEHEANRAMCLAKTQRALSFLSWQRTHLSSELETVAAKARTDPQVAQLALTRMIDAYPTAKKLLDGVTVAIVGRPNSGKSTLFNRMLGRPAAVVSPVAGTTRDWIAEPIEMAGVPVTLMDTAGEHDAASPLERLAVEAGRRHAQRADIRLVLLDGSRPPTLEERKFLDSQLGHGAVVTALTKMDLGSPAVSAWEGRPAESVPISAKVGSGLPDLTARLLGVLGFADWMDVSAAFFTARQVAEARRMQEAILTDSAGAANDLFRRLIGDKPDVEVDADAFRP